MSDKQNHEQKNKRLKRLGIILTAVGAALTATGFIGFFAALAGGGGPPVLFFLCFIGLPMIGVGSTCLRYGYRREVTKYVKDETVPVLNEAAEEAQPALRSVARALREEDRGDAVICPHCGRANDTDAKFCDGCGKPLARICPACGRANDAEAKFCDNCGAPLQEDR